MNWYSTLREQHMKEAGLWDAFTGKMRGNGKPSPIVPLKSDFGKPAGMQNRHVIPTNAGPASGQAQQLKQQLQEVQMEINRLKNEVKYQRDPNAKSTAQNQLQQAVQKQTQILTQMSHQHELDYA